MKWYSWVLWPLQRLYRWWYRLHYGTVSVVVLDDIPDETTPGFLYLVGEDDDFWAASMRCPCGCGDTVTLNLIGPHPVWKAVTGRSGKIGLHPSVDRCAGCRSHYWIREGAVVWANTCVHAVPN